MTDDSSDGELRVLSLFSGCGGMDIGFEGGFSCLKESVNTKIHPEWVEDSNGDMILLKKNRSLSKKVAQSGLF